ncbi:MAG: HD domain-containing protein [Candidatus Gracilibacteria bacterium]|nr:HD domain-containing protein [Candidatus Gracilibacteria bacterium]
MDTKYKEAIEIAKLYHKGQMRKDGTEYITHPLRVATFLKNYGFPEDVLIAGVLHDTCEDTKLTIGEINSKFGTRVGFIINALSKNKKPKNNKKLKLEYDEKKKKRKISNLEKYDNFEEYIDFRFHLYINRLYIGIIAEPWILFIKISDQIDNLSDMKPFSQEKKLRKIEEVEKYFLPIYIKAKNIFTVDLENTKRYNDFISLLQNKIKEVKNNL